MVLSIIGSAGMIIDVSSVFTNTLEALRAFYYGLGHPIVPYRARANFSRRNHPLRPIKKKHL